MVVSPWTAIVVIALLWSGHELLKIVVARSMTVDSGFAIVVALALLVVASTHRLVESIRSRGDSRNARRQRRLSRR